LQAIEQKIGEGVPESTTAESLKTLWKARPDGCKECRNTGYAGRIGIYEVLDNTLAIQKLITANATSSDIQKQAIEDGMITMQTDGLIKALRGNTSLEEVMRVTRE